MMSPPKSLLTKVIAVNRFGVHEKPESDRLVVSGSRKVPQSRDDISYLLLANNHGGEISHYGAAFSKARKQLEMGWLAAVQKTGTQNVIGLGKVGPLALRKGSGGGLAHHNQIRR